MAFNPAGTDIAVSNGNTAPFIQVYPWSSGFGTKYANPATLPATLSALAVRFNPAGTDIAVGGSVGGVSVYPWSAGFGTKYASSSGGAPNGFALAFNAAGTVIAATSSLSPQVVAFPWSSGFGTKYANPATLPGAIGQGIAFLG